MFLRIVLQDSHSKKVPSMTEKTGVQEGGIQPPTRHPIPWQDEAFYDATAIQEEMERVFDICHGCRRCFNLCESFPRLFNLIDATETGELEAVDPQRFGEVVQGCTLCDMCFMTKCPYVPPHPFQLDFPHLMLRARAAEKKASGGSWVGDQLSETDRNGQLARHGAALVNWATKTPNPVTRPLLEKVTGVDRRAALPRFHHQPFVQKATHAPRVINPEAPGWGEKVVLYASCFVNYNDHRIGDAALDVLAYNGVAVQVLYPECCGMPQWERGDVSRVAGKAQRIAEMLLPWVEQGYAILSPVSSCSLMLRMEWPLLWPENEAIKAVGAATLDVAAYLVHLARTKGLVPVPRGLPEGVMLHIPCHARAQNQGRKAQELLQHLPHTPLQILERCSGHGGTWGYLKENFETALKVGRPVARRVAEEGKDAHCVSECPLAASHIHQGADLLETAPQGSSERRFSHPLEVLAYAYGFTS